MTLHKQEIQLVRKAKEHFAKKFADADWLTGVGVAREGDKMVLRVNVSPGTSLPDDLTQDTFEGVPLQIVRMQGYSVR